MSATAISDGRTSDWQDIKTAPRDGTVIEASNEQTRKAKMHLHVRWGAHVNSAGHKSDDWVLVKDHTRYMPMRAGSLIIPDRWREIECCMACDIAFVPGDKVLSDVSGGTLHVACCGPERESYVDADGEPLKDGDPIPQGWEWQP